MNAKSPEHGLGVGRGEASGDGDGDGEVWGHAAGGFGTYVMSKVRSRPGGLRLVCDRSRYFQARGWQNPQPAWSSVRPVSPLAHLSSLPICATLGTGRVVGAGWHPASATRATTAARIFTGDGSGDGIRRLIVRDPGTRLCACVVCLTNPNVAWPESQFGGGIVQWLFARDQKTLQK